MASVSFKISLKISILCYHRCLKGTINLNISAIIWVCVNYCIILRTLVVTKTHSFRDKMALDYEEHKRTYRIEDSPLEKR